MVKKRGIVWNYFTKKIHGSQIIAFCKFCDQSYIQNATRMQRHIERCLKCPENIKQDFINAVRSKSKKSILTMRLVETCSADQPQIVRNRLHGSSTGYGISENVANNSDTIDSKDWNKNVQIDMVQPEEGLVNGDWDSVESNSEIEPTATDEVQETTQESMSTQKSHPNKRFLQPLTSGHVRVSSLDSKIQEESYLEKRALRRIAEIELQRKTLEFEKFKWEYDKEKSQSEVRWAHECRMMELKEEKQRRLTEPTRD